MKNEIEIKYKLPSDWEKTADISFAQLSDFITQLHDSAYTAAVKAVNRFATIRNYMIGFYIVEYEQHGSDRAKYGDKLLRRLAERVNKRGINETLLKVSRAFYLAYPQVKEYLLGKTTELIGSSEKSATASHQFKIPAEKLISQLSFSHIREILTVDNPPVVEELYKPDRTILTLSFIPKQAENTIEERDLLQNETSLKQVLKQVLEKPDFEKIVPILDILEKNKKITVQEAVTLLNKSRTTTWRYLKILVNAGVVEVTGETNNTVYSLRKPD